MKRTRRSAVWSGQGCAGEGVLVAGEFEHPVYGRTVSPAAELVAAWLRRAGVPAAVGPASSRADGAPLSWYGVAYLDPRLGAVGLALGADESDSGRRRDAQAALQAWRQTLCTRRILLPGPASAVLPAQRAAVTRQDPARAAQDFLDEGDSVLVLGPSWPALEGLHPAPRQRVVHADHPRALEGPALRGLDEDSLAFVLAPDVVAEDAAELLRGARAVFPHLRGQQPDLWSYEASDRLNSLRLLLDGADELWLLTAPGPRHPLLESALERSGTAIREFAAPTDIEPHWLTPQLRTIAVVSTDLADGRSGELVSLLSGLGPLGVVTREVSTRITTGDYLPVGR